MDIKPILFNTDMVRTILSDQKTVTRRAVKPLPTGDGSAPEPLITRPGYWNSWGDDFVYRQPCQPDDILYVRETWQVVYDTEYTDDGKAENIQDVITNWDQICKVEAGLSKDHSPVGSEARMKYYVFKADAPMVSKRSPWDKGLRWRPSIHMPKEAARIFLRVTGVRVERLLPPFFEKGNPIFALRAEGVDIGSQCKECINTYGHPCCVDDESECGVLDDVRSDFAGLWDSTLKPADHAAYGWDANPWVWVIEFERCEKPEGWPI